MTAPLIRARSVPGNLPDPRNPNGPTHYQPVPRRTLLDRLEDWASDVMEGERLNTYGAQSRTEETPRKLYSYEMGQDWPTRTPPPRGVGWYFVAVAGGLALLVAALVAF